MPAAHHPWNLHPPTSKRIPGGWEGRGNGSATMATWSRGFPPGSGNCTCVWVWVRYSLHEVKLVPLGGLPGQNQTWARTRLTIHNRLYPFTLSHTECTQLLQVPEKDEWCNVMNQTQPAAAATAQKKDTRTTRTTTTGLLRNKAGISLNGALIGMPFSGWLLSGFIVCRRRLRRRW